MKATSRRPRASWPRAWRIFASNPTRAKLPFHCGAWRSWNCCGKSGNWLATMPRRALTIRRALKDSKGCADTLGTMAWIEICSGNTAKATTCLSESLALAKVIGDRRTLSESLEIAALIHSHEGRAPRVVQLVAGAGRIRERLGFVLQPVRKKFVAEITAKAKGQMSDTTFQGLWQRGESRELNALVELALEG